MFIKDSISILNNLDMLSKSWWLRWTNLASNLWIDDGKHIEECEQQVGDYHVTYKNQKEDQQANNVFQHLCPTKSVTKECPQL